MAEIPIIKKIISLEIIVTEAKKATVPVSRIKIM